MERLVGLRLRRTNLVLNVGHRTIPFIVRRCGRSASKCESLPHPPLVHQPLVVLDGLVARARQRCDSILGSSCQDGWHPVAKLHLRRNRICFIRSSSAKIIGLSYVVHWRDGRENAFLPASAGTLAGRGPRRGNPAPWTVWLRPSAMPVTAGRRGRGGGPCWPRAGKAVPRIWRMMSSRSPRASLVRCLAASAGMSKVACTLSQARDRPAMTAPSSRRCPCLGRGGVPGQAVAAVAEHGLHLRAGRRDCAVPVRRRHGVLQHAGPFSCLGAGGRCPVPGRWRGGREHGRPGLITGDGRGHVRDQHLRAAVDDRQQLLADLTGIGCRDVIRQRHHHLPADPFHRIKVLDHGSRPGAGGKTGTSCRA
jgi:hypothetical protein